VECNSIRKNGMCTRKNNKREEISEKQLRLLKLSKPVVAALCSSWLEMFRTHIIIYLLM